MEFDAQLLRVMQQTIERSANVKEGDSLAHDLMKIAHLILMLGWLERRHFAQVLAARGLTIPQFFTLVTIHRHERGCTMGILAEETHQCSATMTGIIDRLLKMGLVERTRDAKDRRLVLVKLTAVGKEILREALHERLARLREVLEQLNEERRHHIIEALGLYVNLAEKRLAEEAAAQPSVAC